MPHPRSRTLHVLALCALLTLQLGAGTGGPAFADELHDDGAVVVSADEPTVAAPPLAAAAADAATASEPLTTAAFTVEHVWVQSTGLAAGELPHYSATMRFPPIAEGVHAIAHGQVPGGIAQVTHCQLRPFLPQEGTVSISCELRGTLTPGTITISVGIKSEAGDEYLASVPVTLCPEEGCSSLFEVGIEPAAVSLCLGDDLDSVTAAYALNEPWTPVSSSLGEGAPGEIVLADETIRSGSRLALSGRPLSAGMHHLTVDVADEFGGVHEAKLDVDVVTPAPGHCGVPASAQAAPPELAETGGPPPLGAVPAALALMTLGAALLRRRPGALAWGSRTRASRRPFGAE